MKRLKLNEDPREFDYLDDLTSAELCKYNFAMETPSGKRYFLVMSQNGYNLSWVNFGAFERQTFNAYSSYKIHPTQSEWQAIRGAIRNVLKAGMDVYRFKTSKQLIDWVTDNDT